MQYIYYKFCEDSKSSVSNALTKQYANRSASLQGYHSMKKKGFKFISLIVYTIEL